MSFEQHQSFAGQPPTPSRTPPADNFDGNTFGTPRNIESSFYDQGGWDTPKVAASPNLLRTPRPFAPSTPTAGRVGNSFETPGKSQDLHAQAAQLATHQSALFSPQSLSAEFPEEQEKSGSMESMIQTPPPTNTGNGKRREKQNGSNRAHRRSESSNRALLPKPADAGPSMISTDVPIQFTPIAFNTPDIFAQNLEMPATAPVYPQKQLFWDNNDMELDFSAANPFAIPKPSTQGLEPFISSHQPQPAPLLRQAPAAFLDFDQMLPNPDYNITNSIGDINLDVATSFGQGVDPNLLFSSSSAAAISLQAPIGDESLQPYTSQIQGARRDAAYAGINKARRRRKPSVDSPAVAAALETLRDSSSRPGVRRSMTDGHVPRSGRSSSSSSRAGTSHGGRSSPLKQIRSETKRRHRSSVGLVIGADGRARLEPVVHQERGGSSRDGKEHDMDVDSTTYSSGSESSETDDNDNESQNAMVTSFSSDVGSSSGLPKMGRFGNGGHSKHSSFSSLYSNNSDQPKQTKPRKPSSKRTSRHILDPVKEGGSFEDDRSREADSAQAALMHSMKASQRGRYSPQKQSSGLEPFVSSPSIISDSVFAAPTSGTSGRKSTHR